MLKKILPVEFMKAHKWLKTGVHQNPHCGLRSPSENWYKNEHKVKDILLGYMVGNKI